MSPQRVDFPFNLVKVVGARWQAFYWAPTSFENHFFITDNTFFLGFVEKNQSSESLGALGVIALSENQIRFLFRISGSP